MSLRLGSKSKMEQGSQEVSILACQLQLNFSPPSPPYHLYVLELKLNFGGTQS